MEWMYRLLYYSQKDYAARDDLLQHLKAVMVHCFWYVALMW